MIEKALIEECRNGNLNNFRDIVELCSPMVFSIAFRIVGDEEEARDIVQETMVKLWQKLPGIKDTEKFRSWMCRITVNNCNDHLRRRKRNNEVRYDDKAWVVLSDHLSGGGITELENIENARILNFLTNKLSNRQKVVFILSEIEEMPATEVARVTGISRTAVKANLYYARKKMEELLRKYL
ncbi:MAG TPA: RNA polymerase sigma factor [Bacteroidales bacterium]|nr:RNA polymerase sigma factor [Bacteroidales bacterium]